MNDLIVADAGPLIALGLLDSLHLPAAMHRRVIVPLAVERECLARRDKPAAIAIESGFERGLLAREADPSLPGPLIASLGPGESEAIRLAATLQAMLLIDERRGRAVAAARGIPIVGTVAVLLAARQHGLVPSIAPLLHRLRERGYFLSDSLVAAAVQRAGEG